MTDHECEWQLIAETQDRQIERLRATFADLINYGPDRAGVEFAARTECDHGIPFSHSCDECWGEAIIRILEKTK